MFRIFSIPAAMLTLAVASGAVKAAPPEAIDLRRTVTVQVVEHTKAAVVYISTTKLVRERLGNPFFGQFGPGDIVQREAGSLGSGFIVHPDGYVVTNNHVIDRARKITVELLDGRKLDAELISADPDADLAILKIADTKPFPALELGDSADLLIGEPVIAVGNPLGFSHSVSTGIVSALHRELKGDQNKTLLADLIQTDTAINPGNSGGPLLNAYGQVIGINTAIRNDAQNIGFAIQINVLRDLIPELMNPRQVTKSVVPFVLHETRSSTPPANVTTRITIKGGANDGSELVDIAGYKPTNIIDAYAHLLLLKSGEPATVALGGGKKVTFTPEAAPLPDVVVQAKKSLGITVEPVTPLVAQKLSLGSEDGLLVSEVTNDGIAAKAGIQPGDIITRLGRYNVKNLKDLGTLLPLIPQGSRVQVGVVRGERVGYGFMQF